MGSAFVNKLGLPVHRLPLAELAKFLPMVFEVSVDLVCLVASVCYGTTTSNQQWVSSLLPSHMKTKDELASTIRTLRDKQDLNLAFRNTWLLKPLPRE